MSGGPALSVVVATRNRSSSLARLLFGLSAQVDAPPFEVIVADNGSEDDTGAVISRAADTLPVRGVYMDRPGKGRALNAALRAATGALVVFTDDDVVPDPRWLAELHTAQLEHPETGVFGGAIIVDPACVPRWIRRSHNLMGLLTSEHLDLADSVYGFGRYPFGPNMAVRRDRLADVKTPYPEDMGPGTSLPVGDESAFLLRISPPDARDRIFVPAARVYHEVEPPNVTFVEAMRRSFFQGRAQRRLAIPVVPTNASGRRGSILLHTVARIRACRSARELACVCVRQAGFLLGVPR